MWLENKTWSNRLIMLIVWWNQTKETLQYKCSRKQIFLFHGVTCLYVARAPAIDWTLFIDFLSITNFTLYGLKFAYM